jgi:hypothetical protein
MKHMLRKTWLIGIVILFVGASVLPSINAEIKIKEIVPTMADWSDNFDSYENGQYLDGDPEDGGWHGWDGDPNAGAYVVDYEFLSTPHSVELIDVEDLVHEFEGIDSGQWTFTTWVYIPGDIMGIAYFIMLNTYSDGGPHHWSTQVAFDPNTGEVISEPELETLTLLYDEWVEIRVEIDLDADLQAIYYDGDLLTEKGWSDGVSGAGGLTEIQCVDLWSNGATEHYYDDFSLVGPPVAGPDLDCDGSLSWTEVEPGAIVTGDFTVENIGEPESLLDWEIESYPDWGTWTFNPDGGTGLLQGETETVDVEVVAPDDEETNFTGEIVLVNSEDPDDTCVIDIRLSTPVNQQVVINPLFQMILERFPNVFPILRHLLGL